MIGLVVPLVKRSVNDATLPPLESRCSSALSFHSLPPSQALPSAYL